MIAQPLWRVALARFALTLPLCGISVTAVKPLSMPMKLIEARPKNSRLRFIFMLGSPFRISTGAMISTARKLRKNTTSITGTNADDRRMQIPMVVNRNSASSIISDA